MRRDLSPWSPAKSSMSPDLVRGNFIGSFLEDFFNNSFMAGFSSPMRTDIKESQDDYVLEIEMPGYVKEDIRVECMDGRITVSAHHLHQRDEEQQNYIRQERHHGKVSRSYSFDDIDEEMVRAEYKEGILKITVPKLKESMQLRKQLDIL